MPPAEGLAEPIAREPGGFYFPFTREEVNTARQPAPVPQMTSFPHSPAAANSPMGCTDFYRAEDLKILEPTGFPETEPGTETLSDKTGPGLNTFLNFPVPAAPPPEPVSPPRSVNRPVRRTVTFDPPAPHPPVTEPSDLFSPPPQPLPSAAVQPVIRQPAVPGTRSTPAPLFSMRIATLAALGLIAVAAIVVLIVESSA